MTADLSIESLRSRHRHLEEVLHGELRRPSPDTLRIAALKKEKLALKDEMARLNGETTH